MDRDTRYVDCTWTVVGTYDLIIIVIFSKAKEPQIYDDMIRRGADSNAKVWGWQGWVLHDAVRYEDITLVNALINTGYADIDARDALGRTPLMATKKNGIRTTCEVVDLLVERGADIHAVDLIGCSVLHHAIAIYSDELQGWLYDANLIVTTNLQLVRQLLERGADPNHQDSTGQTPMTALLSLQRVTMTRTVQEIIKILLPAGADPFHVDHEGRSAALLLQETPDSRLFIHQHQGFFRH